MLALVPTLADISIVSPLPFGVESARIARLLSSCSKSSIGLAVAQQLGCAFVDGDDLHPAANVAKMSEGHPLNDQVSR